MFACYHGDMRDVKSQVWISHTGYVILFFQVGEGGFVATLAVIEPEGDTGNGGGWDPDPFSDI